MRSVYVIRLQDEVAQDTRFREANPDYRDGKPCVYVGETGLSVDERFRNHLAGHRASRWVTKFGRHLIRRRCRIEVATNAEEAHAQEAALAARLRRRGWGVWSN